MWAYLIPGSGAEFGQLLLDSVQRDGCVGQVEEVHHIVVGGEGLEVGGVRRNPVKEVIEDFYDFSICFVGWPVALTLTSSFSHTVTVVPV